MSLCVEVVNSVLQASVSETCEYVLLTKNELSNLINSQTDWAAYLEFDSELFELLLGVSLTTFVAGHALGRIVKSFGKI